MKDYSLFNNCSLYIPQVRDSVIATSGVIVPSLFLEGHTVAHSPTTLEKVKPYTEDIFINPVTSAIQLTPDDDKLRHIKKLPYFLDKANFKKVFSDASYRLENFVNPVIDFQLAHGANNIISPYLYSDEINSAQFNLNISMLVDTIKSLKARDKKLSCYAVIHMSSNILSNIGDLNYIIARYTKDYEDDLFGVIIHLSDFDSKRATDSSLQGLAHLVYQLSQYKHVIVYKSDAFGEVLLAVGASAYVSGIYEAESFSVSKYTNEQKSRKSPRIYLPLLMDRLNIEDIKKIHYPRYIKGELDSTAGKLKHYIASKSKYANKMALLEDQHERMDYMINRIAEAKEFGDRLRNDFGLKIQNSHLHKWVDVLNLAKKWTSVGEEEVSLADLLEELKKP